MLREYIDGSVDDVLSGDGTEFSDGRMPGDSLGLSRPELLENCDRMEEFGLWTIGEDLSECHGIVCIRFRMESRRDFGDAENPGKNFDEAHRVLLSVGKEEWLEYTIFLSGKEVIL